MIFVGRLRQRLAQSLTTFTAKGVLMGSSSSTASERVRDFLRETMLPRYGATIKCSGAEVSVDDLWEVAEKCIGAQAVPSLTDPFGNGLDPVGAIAMRLHLREGDRLPFRDIHAVRASADLFHVFVLTEKGPVVLDDDALFPSDTLITKLRLLAG